MSVACSVWWASFGVRGSLSYKSSKFFVMVSLVTRNAILTCMPVSTGCCCASRNPAICVASCTNLPASSGCMIRVHSTRLWVVSCDFAAPLALSVAVSALTVGARATYGMAPPPRPVGAGVPAGVRVFGTDVAPCVSPVSFVLFVSVASCASAASLTGSSALAWPASACSPGGGSWIMPCPAAVSPLVVSVLGFKRTGWAVGVERTVERTGLAPTRHDVLALVDEVVPVSLHLVLLALSHWYVIAV